MQGRQLRVVASWISGSRRRSPPGRFRQLRTIPREGAAYRWKLLQRPSAGFLQKIHDFFRRSDSPTASNADRFIAEAKRLDARPTILIIGGGAIGSDADALYRDPDITLIGTDVYKSDLTLIIADGHQLPLASGAIHGVWIQA